MLMYMGKSLLIFSDPLLDFSVSGWHGFGSVTQVFFRISVSNFMCISFVAVSRSLTIVSYVAFKMAALWFWTMFNCNPPIAHCHPLLWGGGILVDHWSTISSCFCEFASGSWYMKRRYFHTDWSCHSQSHVLFVVLFLKVRYPRNILQFIVALHPKNDNFKNKTIKDDSLSLH